MREVPWEDRVEARKECFMSPGGGLSYTYGRGPGERTYTSIPMMSEIALVMLRINNMSQCLFNEVQPLNACFLNRYDDERKALGWHADDYEGMDREAPVAVISFGEAREIWWRKSGEGGEVPPEQRQLLDSGSLFIMPPGFQQAYQHRIPGGGCKMGPRVSLTFRRFA